MSQHSPEHPSAAPAAAPKGDGRPRALVLAFDSTLAQHLSALHPAVRTALLKRLPGASKGVLRDTDALLLLAGPGRTGLPDRVTAIYIGTDLDDAGVWARAVNLRTNQVMFSPDADAELADLLARCLDAPSTRRPGSVKGGKENGGDGLSPPDDQGGPPRLSEGEDGDGWIEEVCAGWVRVSGPSGASILMPQRDEHSGQCTGCSASPERYGEHGSPYCRRCRPHP